MAIKNKHFYAIKNKQGYFVSTVHDYFETHVLYTKSNTPKRYYDDDFKAQIFANFINNEIGKEELYVVEIFPQVVGCSPWDRLTKGWSKAPVFIPGDVRPLPY